MTATLTFDLNDFDDRQAHLRCVHALDMALVIWEIEVKLKNSVEQEIRQSNSVLKETLIQGMEMTLDAIRDIIKDHNINTDDLIS